ncbi:MAG: response regulator [Elusimicrobia bacterium]|nr:response regulator [Elusimicrobiota bacterium]
MAAKILIVDDEPAIAENLQAILNAKGYETSCAYDGAEAVAKARHEKPNLILLDVMLPKMDGFDVCRLLKSDPDGAKLKVLMITGLDHMGDVEKAFQSGASDYLIKPFGSVKLLQKVEKLLSGA